MTTFSFTWLDAVDILLVTFLIYYVILFVRGTRAIAALNGLFFLFALYLIAQVIGLNALVWIFENIFSSLFLVIVILFHEDIRQGLSTLNVYSLFNLKQEYTSSTIDILTDTCFSLAEKNIGALIVLEVHVPLGDITEKAVQLNSIMSQDLLETIFYPGSPLHDGAVLLSKNGRIKAAGCILPLASVQRQHFGTRHRAAIGITERSDALAIVVSEERGEVTIAQHGNLSNPLGKERFVRVLNNVISK